MSISSSLLNIIVMLFLIVLTFITVFLRYKLEQNSKLLYKVPAYTTLITLGIAILLTITLFIRIATSEDAADAGIVIIVIPYIFIGVLISLVVSFVITLPLYLVENLKIILIVLGVIMVIMVSTSVYLMFGKECPRFDDFCWSDKALEANDPTLCNNNANKDSCYNILAQLANDESICVMIEEEDQKNGCIIVEAQKKYDEKICELINKDYDRGICLRRVAERKKDASICSLINVEQIKEGCYEFLDEYFNISINVT